MRNAITAKKELLARVADILERDERVQALFLAGSLGRGNITPVSDIDLWVVLFEESGINLFCKEIKEIFSKAGILRGSYECTAHHFFLIYKNGVQLDLNLVTAAQYWSLAGNNGKKALFDRNLPILPKDRRAARDDAAAISELLLVGYTTLERGISKYLKKDYFAAVRFLNAVRHTSMIPLLPFFEAIGIPNAASLEIGKLTPESRELIIDSYARPVEASCRESLCSCLKMLDLAAKKTDNGDYKDISARLSKLIVG